MSNSKLTEVRFHLYSLKFTAYKDSTLNSTDILFKAITYVTNQYDQGKGYLIDRHLKREKDEPRELFMTKPVIMLKEKRIRGTIALLRSNRVPLMKPADKFLLVPIDVSSTFWIAWCLNFWFCVHFGALLTLQFKSLLK